MSTIAPMEGGIAPWKFVLNVTPCACCSLCVITLCLLMTYTELIKYCYVLYGLWRSEIRSDPSPGWMSQVLHFWVCFWVFSTTVCFMHLFIFLCFLLNIFHWSLVVLERSSAQSCPRATDKFHFIQLGTWAVRARTILHCF